MNIRRIINYGTLTAILGLTFVSVSALAQSESTPEDTANNVINDVLSRGDNIFLGLIEAIWGGGTAFNQTPNLLGTLSAVVAPVLGFAVLVIVTYKGFSWAVKTGVSGESGGEQGPTRVSVAWASLVIPFAFIAVTPWGVSGYSPVQYFAHYAATKGVEFGDLVAVAGVEWFVSPENVDRSEMKQNEKDAASLNLGGATTRLDSPDIELIFSAVAVANACRVGTNSQLANQNKHVVVREHTVKGYAQHTTQIFSYELEDKDQGSKSDPLNGFCGQIRLRQTGPTQAHDFFNSQYDDVAWLLDGDYDNSGMYQEKFTQDVASIKKFIVRFQEISRPYEESYSKENMLDSIEEDAAVITHDIADLETYSQTNPPQDELVKRQAKVDSDIEALNEKKELIAKKIDFLNSQTNSYIAAQEQLKTDIAATAREMVGEYENISAGGVSFRDELDQRGLLVLGTQYWGITQLSNRARELSRLKLTTIDATLSDDTGSWVASLNQAVSIKALTDQFQSAKPWKKNQILTAKGAGYKSRRSEERDEGGGLINTDYNDDQAYLSANKIAEMLASGLKGIVNSSDNLIVSVQNLGDFVGTFGWTAWIVTGPLNPIAAEEDDSFLVGAGKKLIGIAAVATTAATPLSWTAVIAAAAAWIGELLRTFSVPMILLGGFMSYYIPAMPAVFFYMALFGYLIIFIEAVIVLPIWTTLLCFTAGSDGWETAHMRQGVVLLVGLAARLAGNVMVFFTVIMLLDTAGPLFVSLIADVYLSTFSTSTAGIAGYLFMAGGVAFFAYQLIIRSFSLINELMDMMMRGMNVGHQTFGMQSDEERGRTLVVGVMNKTGALLRPSSPNSQQ
jgi:conjugal transfer/type IV secretion protein DotA/TraY